MKKIIRFPVNTRFKIVIIFFNGAKKNLSGDTTVLTFHPSLKTNNNYRVVVIDYGIMRG
jgi:hypothetical protein